MPLQLKDLKAGDTLEWNSLTDTEICYHEDIKMIVGQWLFLGEAHTPRNQEWLNNPKLDVRLKRPIDAS